MRHTRKFIAIGLLAGFLTAKPAYALSEFTQLTADNLDKQDAFRFSIKADKTQDGMHFVVTIKPTEYGSFSSIMEGNLTIMDGQNQIASCPVQRQEIKKTVVYEFVVAEKYLKKSEFEFGNMAGDNAQPMPAGDFYWFYLSDLANLKNH